MAMGMMARAVTASMFWSCGVDSCVETARFYIPGIVIDGNFHWHCMQSHEINQSALSLTGRVYAEHEWLEDSNAYVFFSVMESK